MFSQQHWKTPENALITFIFMNWGIIIHFTTNWSFGAPVNSSLTVDVFQGLPVTLFFKCALRSGGIREKWTRSNGDRSWSGQNLHQKEKENYECYELHSFVITQRDIPKRWLEKISRKDAFIYSHRLTGFPVEGRNPWPWEQIRGTRVAIVLLREHFQKWFPYYLLLRIS